MQRRFISGAACAVLLLSAQVGQAEVQRTETLTFTGADAAPFAKAFEPVLAAEPVDVAAKGMPRSMDVSRMQLERLRGGAYKALSVRFQLQRHGDAARRSPAIVAGTLPNGEDDVITVATCGPAVSSGYLATVDVTYTRKAGQWTVESKRYQQVEGCGGFTG